MSISTALLVSVREGAHCLPVTGVLSPVLRLRSSRRCAALNSHLRARAFQLSIVASDELAPLVMGGTPRAGRNRHRGVKRRKRVATRALTRLCFDPAWSSWSVSPTTFTVLRQIEALPERPGGDPTVQDLSALLLVGVLMAPTKRVFSFWTSSISSGAKPARAMVMR